MLFKNFYPKEWVDSAYSIDYTALYSEGYRGIIFDIDNTLVEHGADASEEAIKLFDSLKNIGYNICLLSNNKKPRVERFNKDVNVNYIFQAQKPISKNYLAAAVMMRTSIKHTLCIGDQIFTDIYGANKTGIYSILVKPISKKEVLQVRLKRKLEAIVLFFYKRKLRKLKKEK